MTHPQPITKTDRHYSFLKRMGIPDYYPIFKNRQGREFILAGARKETIQGRYKWFAHIFFVKGGHKDVPFEKIEEYEKVQFNYLRNRKK